MSLLLRRNDHTYPPSRAVFAFMMVLCLAVVGSNSYAQEPFSHPGLLLSQSDIKQATEASKASDDVQTYEMMESDPRASFEYVPTPFADVALKVRKLTPESRALKDDGTAAYLNAVQWVVTHDDRHRAAAVRILNSWARTFESFTVLAGTPRQPQLVSAWALPLYTSAAELVVHGDGGQTQPEGFDAQGFRDFTYRMLGYARQAHDRDNNWGATASLAMMTVGVYNNDRALYEEGLESVKRRMENVIKPNGEVFELRTRDCHHPQYSLTALTQAAEIASNQGDDSLWLFMDDEQGPLLARGIEYMSASLLTGKGARNCVKSSLAPGYGWIAEAAYDRLNVPIPMLRKITDMEGLDGPSYQFLGWSAFGH